jgi:hypothetical protein
MSNTSVVFADTRGAYVLWIMPHKYRSQTKEYWTRPDELPTLNGEKLRGESLRAPLATRQA